MRPKTWNSRAQGRSYRDILWVDVEPRPTTGMGKFISPHVL
jgi:hypothetical protein